MRLLNQICYRCGFDPLTSANQQRGSYKKHKLNAQLMLQLLSQIKKIHKKSHSSINCFRIRYAFTKKLPTRNYVAQKKFMKLGKRHHYITQNVKLYYKVSPDSLILSHTHTQTHTHTHTHTHTQKHTERYTHINKLSHILRHKITNELDNSKNRNSVNRKFDLNASHGHKI